MDLPGRISTKQQIKCLAEEHNTVTPPAVMFELATLESPNDLSTEPLHSTLDVDEDSDKTSGCEYVRNDIVPKSYVVVPMFYMKQLIQHHLYYSHIKRIFKKSFLQGILSDWIFLQGTI